MKIVTTHSLIDSGGYSASLEWDKIRSALHRAIQSVDWPPGSGRFTIYPQSGKKRGEGNGVTPIKNGLMTELRSQGWTIEGQAKNRLGKNLGDYDAVLKTAALGLVVLEWETGNISSSHRSTNKMTMNLANGLIGAAVLVVPSKSLAKYLTDRIGNIDELERYFEFWKSVPCVRGVLDVVVIEHDAESLDVPRIPKGTDGRAKV